MSAITHIELPGINKFKSGKVREVYDLGDNYLFIAFSGEEYGLFGSSYYAKNPTIELENVKFMLNFDMVGRLNEENQLAINGVGTSTYWEALLDSSNSFDFDLKPCSENLLSHHLNHLFLLLNFHFHL